tara:strand:+ start:1105 stop:1755 length:651 start_codon:yes stop_codon:yes gene_type:complete
MDSERKNSIAIILILISLLLVVAYVVFQPSKDYTYRGPTGEFFFEQKNTGNFEFYSFEMIVIYDEGKDVVKQTMNLRNGPRELKDIPTEGDLQEAVFRYKNRFSDVYITVDPQSSSKTVIAGTEIGQVLGRAESGIFKMYARGALTKEGTNTVDGTMPIISCADVTDNTGVIYLEEGAPQGVIVDDVGCIHIRGETPEEVIESADRLIYVLLGIMN